MNGKLFELTWSREMQLRFTLRHLKYSDLFHQSIYESFFLNWSLKLNYFQIFLSHSQAKLEVLRSTWNVMKEELDIRWRIKFKSLRTSQTPWIAAQQFSNIFRIIFVKFVGKCFLLRRLQMGEVRGDEEDILHCLEWRMRKRL